MTNANDSASEELLSTVAVLPDQVLLEQTRMLARHEQALQLSVLDHLREIEARRLYLRLGYSSLFDYTVRELHYTEAAAWRRIKAMRLCRETRGVRERLQDGSLNLSNAALLQNSFERWDRGGGRPVAAGSPGAGRGAAESPAVGTSAAPRAGSAPAAAPGKAADARLPVLDAHARQHLVERAMGKSTRQVQQMLAEVDPEAAAPAERLRALGNGRWELKAVVDGECQQGLQRLRELLSHVDPHLTVGQLVGRLVREGVARYDPSRPPRRKRRKSDPAGDKCSVETAGREPADRVAAAAAAENPRQAEKSAAPTTSPCAPKRSATPTAIGTLPVVLPSGEGSGTTSPERRLGPSPGSGTSAPKCVAPRVERTGSADGAVAIELTSAPKRDAPRADRAGSGGAAVATELTAAAKSCVAAGSSIPAPSSDGAGSAEQTSAPKPRVATGGGGLAEQTSAAKSGKPVGRSIPYRRAGGGGSAGRTAAAKPIKSSGRSIPAGVRREVWRRDQGCCTYVDRHTGRRCGSRFFLELDHIVPVARGGGAEPGNLRL